MKSYRNGRRVRGAFTLLEVLMVIVILGVLVALIAPNFIGTGEKAKADATKTSIEGLRTSLETFRMHCNRYPTTEEGLAALLTKPGAEDIGDKWSGPYLTKPARDGWNRDLNYASPGRVNETGYDIWSVGIDGKDGTDDDIANWEKTRR